MNTEKQVFVDINNAHGDKMPAVLQKIIDDGVDPFSLEHMMKYHERPILKVGEYWFVTENQWPYQNTKTQLLFITLKYIESFIELSSEAILEFHSLLKEFSEIYNINGGALCMRFGETSLTGATVKHLHAQLIEADIEKGGVTFPIGRNLRK